LSDVDTDFKRGEESDPYSADEHNKRFLQAVSYLIEWGKHIITLGTALMVLSVALLKDVVRDARAPISYLFACLLVLFYLSMLGAIWRALSFVRLAARCVLTAAPRIGTGEELASLQGSLKGVQRLFLSSLTFFSGLALCALLAWAFGLASPETAL
jgi:hypothetical protein